MRTPRLYTKNLLHAGCAILAAGALCTLPVRAANPTTLESTREQSGDLDEILANARAAARRSAWAELGADLVLSGAASVTGIDSTFELTLSPEGRFRNTISGPLGATRAYDGTSGWRQPINGPAGPLSGEELENALLMQWTVSGFWLEEESRLEISFVEEDANEVSLRLAFRNSHNEALLVLDRATWLPRELIRGDDEQQVVTSYEGYKEQLGLQIPHRMATRNQGATSKVEVQAVALAPVRKDLCEARYTMPEAPPIDTSFVSELEGEIEIRRVRSGHLIERPLIEGEDLGWFIFDTGAGKMCIDPRVADKLELPEFGSIVATGVSGTIVAGFRQGKAFELGPLVMKDPVYLELDLAFLEPALGVPLSGIVGHELFARSIVELDIEGPRAAIFDPETYELASGAWTPMSIEDRLPTIHCNFEGDRSGLFKIDTGDPGSVGFHSPAVESLGLLEGRRVQMTQLGGVGGMTSAKAGQLAWFELGGRRFENVNATFATSAVGAHAGTGALGTLGSTLLKPFRVVFDYPSQRIAFGPRLGS